MNESFAMEIEDIIWDKDVTYMEAVLIWAENNSYDPESVALLIKKDPVLKQKINEEAAQANLLKVKKGKTLPV